MSGTTGIFSFDHGQKKLNKAIGVTEEFLNDLQTELHEVLRDYLFDEDRNIKDDLSPSMLIEGCLHKFSYSQLVVLAGMFLQTKTEQFGEMISDKLETAIKIASKDVPEDIREILTRLAEESGSEGIDGDKLPKNVKEFLDKLSRRRKGDGDND
jgi:hypothetical protein